MIPAELTPGNYTLEVRTSLSTGTLRTGILEATLTVRSSFHKQIGIRHKNKENNKCQEWLLPIQSMM